MLLLGVLEMTTYSRQPARQRGVEVDVVCGVVEWWGWSSDIVIINFDKLINTQIPTVFRIFKPNLKVRFVIECL